MLPDDQTFLDSVPQRTIQLFRESVFSRDFIQSQPHIFLDTNWINIAHLRSFLASQVTVAHSATQHLSIPVKDEPPNHSQPLSIKDEPLDVTISHPSISLVRTRTLKGPDNREVIHILSSDSEGSENEAATTEDRDEAYLDIDTSSGWNSELPSEWMSDEQDGYTSDNDSTTNPDTDDELEVAFDSARFIEVSDTEWCDDKIKSRVISCDTQITTKLTVQRVEYLTEIPWVWPIPRIPTAFLLDLRDPKFNIMNKDGSLYRPDALIKNKSQDSWKGSPGSSQGTPQVRLMPGGLQIKCRRSRLQCGGCFSCSEVDPKLLDVRRYELDPAARDKIFAAQRKMRREEGNTAEKRTVIFFNTITSRKCDATDVNSKQCSGKPKLKEQKKIFDGRKFWIGCSGWKHDFRENHRFTKIPDYVDEDVLEKLMKGKSISDGANLDTQACSCIVSSHIGLKQKYCPHPHIINGAAKERARIQHRECDAQLTIYIPKTDDPDLRVALIVPKIVPHNHPMPPMVKASYETKIAYKKCIKAISLTGVTVQKVDLAPSTRLLLGGDPSEYDPTLHDKRIKRNMVRDLKLEKHPAGLGILGAFALREEEVNKPTKERYLHSIVSRDDGMHLIFTFVPYLLNLLHTADAAEGDIQYKRVADPFNEYEMVIYCPDIQRSITIGRIYTNRHDTHHYKLMFDEIRRLTLALTGKPMLFKRLAPGGNLLVMNTDMEAAEVLGICQSFLETNVPEYSKIPSGTTPEQLARYFVRLCLGHGKRAVLDFKGLVSVDDHRRLMGFPYLKSRKELDDFTAFVKGLGVKKIQDWWTHKTQSEWILPCILKSESFILPEHWDITPATTNTGEAQHHWTNKQSGIKLSLVEAIESGREIDARVAREVESALKSGVLVNKHTDLHHRISRNSQRQSTTARKVHQNNEITSQTTETRRLIEEEKEARRQSTLRQKELEEKLKSIPGKGSGHTKVTKRVHQAETSSSGRVKNTKTSAKTTRSAYGFTSASLTVNAELAPVLAQPQVPHLTPNPNTDPNEVQQPSLPVENAGSASGPATLSFMEMLHGDLDPDEFYSSFDLPEFSLDEDFPRPLEGDITSRYDALPLLPQPPVPLSRSSSPQKPPESVNKHYTRKRRRNEVDENDILPVGSHRTKRATSRALQMTS